MNPKQLSIALRRIAKAIDASKKPSRVLVAADLRKVLRFAFGESQDAVGCSDNACDTVTGGEMFGGDVLGDHGPQEHGGEAFEVDEDEDDGYGM